MKRNKMARKNLGMEKRDVMMEVVRVRVVRLGWVVGLGLVGLGGGGSMAAGSWLEMKVGCRLWGNITWGVWVRPFIEVLRTKEVAEGFMHSEWSAPRDVGNVGRSRALPETEE